MKPGDESKSFQTTRWSRVLLSGGREPESRRALNELCEQYYSPVLEFLRFRLGCDDLARDAAQGFFTRILSGSGFSGADPNRGRFRSYLLGALKHFLSDQYDSSQRQPRTISSNPGQDQSDLGFKALNSPRDFTDMDLVFDRPWALALLDTALAELGKELEQERQKDVWNHLKPWLSLHPGDQSKEETMRTLGLSEGAFRVTIHRLRKRFREILKSEIMQTVENSAEAHEEWQYLVLVLSHSETGIPR
jgi:RNA polymerase sigma-70 factor (ECF subfamily)